MLGGWLELTLMYNGLLSGFLYGLYLPVDRFSVKSRKLTTLWFVSLTMFSLSGSGQLVLSNQAKLSSLYKPILFFPYFSPN